MSAKEKKIGMGWFDRSAVLVLIVVGTFIFLCLLLLLVGGLGTLPEALGTAELQAALRLSLITASLSTVLCLVLALPSAYALVYGKMPAKNLWRTLIELPMSLPNLLLGLCLLLVFSSPPGKFLRDLGFQVIFDFRGIILAQSIVNLPFAIRLMTTAFSQLEPRLLVVAGSLGASKWQRFYSIILPLSRSAILTMVLLTWSRAMGEFGATLMLVGATRFKTETLPTSIYLQLSMGNQSMAMASGVLLLLVSLGASLVIQLFQAKKNSRVSL